MSASRNSRSRSARATISSRTPRTGGSSRAACTQAPGGGRSRASSSPSRSSSNPLLPTRTTRPSCRVGSSFEVVAKLAEAARDPAGDRPGGELELIADRPVALVAREEAVEHLAARLWQPRQRLLHREGLVEVGNDRLVVSRDDFLRRLLAPLVGEAVEAQPPSQLCDPRPHRRVVPERVEPVVDAREDLLEDIFGVVLAQAEALRRDRVDVAREAVDELAPRLRLTAPAAVDELRVAEVRRHQGPESSARAAASRAVSSACRAASARSSSPPTVRLSATSFAAARTAPSARTAAAAASPR